MECPYNLEELKTRFNLILDKHGEPLRNDGHDAWDFDGDGYWLAPGKHRYVVYEQYLDDGDVDVWLFETAADVVHRISVSLDNNGDEHGWHVTKVFDLWRPGGEFDIPLEVPVVVRAAWDDPRGNTVFVETQVWVSSPE